MQNDMLGTDYSYYIREINDVKILTDKEQRELFQEYHNGSEEAFLKIYKSNLKYVIKVAKHYYIPNQFLSLMDLIQEGNLGLIKAIEKYDEKRNENFLTYATWWINNYLQRIILNNKDLISIPINKYKEYLIYINVYENLMKKLYRKPSITEIAIEMNISKEKVLILDRIGQILKIKNIENLNDADKNLLNYIKADSEDEPEEFLKKRIKIEEEEEFLDLLEENQLTKKQIDVIKVRYGFLDNEYKTLEKTAKILKFKNKKSVFAIEKRALKKMKHITQIKNIAKKYGFEIDNERNLKRHI